MKAKLQPMKHVKILKSDSEEQAKQKGRRESKKAKKLLKKSRQASKAHKFSTID